MPALLTHIGRYEIKCLIGRGGMGELYLARDTNPNTARLVALKLLNASLDSADLRDRFSREAQALASLSHPNIVGIYDFDYFESSPYIVMEYVRGETVAEKIKRRAPMSLAEKLKLMAELCAGLAHAHDMGIIHRDIKPANLMVDPEGRLKILDFGIARVTEGSLTRLQLTQMNVRIGTPGYMSPEQIEGLEIDARSDLFAVGAVCYELLTYHEAFTGRTTRQVEDQVLKAEPVPIRSLVGTLHPEIDAEIEAIVSRALEKDRDRRYQDAGAMAEDLDRQRMRFRSTATPVPASRPTPRPGAKVRGSRADGAYQRALAVYQEGASEAARRYVIEALAEDPNHAGAKELLANLEPRPWETVPGRTLPHRFSQTVPSPYDAAEATRLVESGTVAPYDALSEAPTVLKTPKRPVAPPSRWKLYRTAAVAAVVVALVAGAVALTLLLTGYFSPKGQMLTIDRPTGGTITGKGIRCGTGGTDCSAAFDPEQTVELDVQPDRGFVFQSYTGDCAPAGRTTMAAARRCGAVFERLAETPPVTPAVKRVLTIEPPKGGTILSDGIKCGTLGNDCSQEFFDGTQVTLYTMADKGFSAGARFTGPCAPRGEVTMSTDRTCSATFQPSPVAQQSPPTTSPPRSTPPARTPTPSVQPPAIEAPSIPTQPEMPERLPPGSPRENLPVPPPITPDEQAKKDIAETLRAFCEAYEQRNLAGIRQVFPAAPASMGDQFKLLVPDSVKCAFGDTPKYVQLDSGRGTAVLDAPVKLEYKLDVGGGKNTLDGVFHAQMSRVAPRTPWIIQKMEFRRR